MIGKLASEAFSVSTISCAGPDFTLFGKNDPSSDSLGSMRILSRKPSGAFMSNRSSMRRATSSSELTSSASSILLLDPSMLMRSGMEYALLFFAERGFSNKSAGPPALDTRSVISVISKSTSAWTEMRFNSPSRSKRVTNSCKSL